mmetsp:Transcript_12143/g.11995  ORF Transcript_12143/g.11995 Transcript_12143/m.11995 type:complete len:131 (-) Transcript_12143:1001-1393(-)
MTSLICSLNAVPNFGNEHQELDFNRNSLSLSDSKERSTDLLIARKPHSNEFLFNALKSLLQATTLRQMFLSAKGSLKKVLACSSVHFLICDKDLAQVFHNEKGLTQQLHLEQDSLDLVILEQTSKKDLQF